MNWLCNPRGKSNTFRAVNWAMELNNFYMKLIFAGSGPNHTLEHIIEQSSLIDLLRACHTIIKDNYFIGQWSIHHLVSDMACTFEWLSQELERIQPHCFKAGCKAVFSYMDALYQGITELATQPNFIVNSFFVEEETGVHEVTVGDLHID